MHADGVILSAVLTEGIGAVVGGEGEGSADRLTEFLVDDGYMRSYARWLGGSRLPEGVRKDLLCRCGAWRAVDEITHDHRFCPR